MGDLINRQQAIDALSLGKEMLSRVLDDIDVVGTVREKYSWGLGLIESYINDINELPSAQPEPTYEQVEEYCKRRCLHVVTADFFESTKPQRLGHWILYDKRFPWRTWYKCSECGNYLDFSGVNGGRGEANYCPNCGARMMKGERSETD